MEIDNIVAEFQFVGSRIIEYTLKTESINHTKLKMGVDIDYSISEIINMKEKNIGNILLSIKIRGINELEECVINISLDIEGMFISNPNVMSKEKFKEMIEQNGLVTLSQIARSYLVGATALAGINPPIKLPMINIYKMIENKRKLS